MTFIIAYLIVQRRRIRKHWNSFKIESLIAHRRRIRTHQFPVRNTHFCDIFRFIEKYRNCHTKQNNFLQNSFLFRGYFMQSFFCNFFFSFSVFFYDIVTKNLKMSHKKECFAREIESLVVHKKYDMKP